MGLIVNHYIDENMEVYYESYWAVREVKPDYHRKQCDIMFYGYERKGDRRVIGKMPYTVSGPDFDKWFGEDVLACEGVTPRSQAYEYVINLPIPWVEEGQEPPRDFFHNAIMD